LSLIWVVTTYKLGSRRARSPKGWAVVNW